MLDLTNQVTALKNELDETQKQSEKQSKGEKKLRDELEHAKMQFLDMQSAERIVRIDLEQVKRSVSGLKTTPLKSFSHPLNMAVFKVRVVSKHDRAVDLLDAWSWHAGHW